MEVLVDISVSIFSGALKTVKANNQHSDSNGKLKHLVDVSWRFSAHRLLYFFGSPVTNQVLEVIKQAVGIILLLQSQMG